MLTTKRPKLSDEPGDDSPGSTVQTGAVVLEFTHHFAVGTSQQRDPHTEAQVFTDEPDRAISQQEVCSASVERVSLAAALGL